MEKSTILRFVKTLEGKYSNEEQSIQEPMKFAHINIFFQPIYLSNFKEQIIYSEQSYNYDPWTPYRQSLLRVLLKDKHIILENYKINDPIRFAGGGFMPQLLESIKSCNLTQKKGCSMYFEEIHFGHYIGEIESGYSCLVNHSGKKTFVKSNVEFNKEKWTVLDEGFDTMTGLKVWGSDHGPIKFKKVICLINQAKNS